ncbi:MAG: efflux RND transporter periplasmic adaptor subunit [Desulfobacterales bacterium]|nr:efflux RND transporter periplasmic adaptor subunit [Desulfobacterales bacterium]
MKTKKRWGLFISALLFCLAAGLAWQWDIVGKHVVSAAVEKGTEDSGKETQSGKTHRTVGVVNPRLVTGGTAITLPGRARAATEATLFFRVSAPLAKIYANPGDHVKKGDILLELDDRDFLRQVSVVESQLKSARANLQKMLTGARPEDIRIITRNLEAAVADLELAKKELERHEILYQNQAVSEQAYDRAKTTVQSLEAQVAALEEQLARDKKGARKEDIMTARATIEEIEVRLSIAKDQLGDTRLLAPFDGVVTRRIPDAHEMVQQGAPVMMLDDILHLEIPVAVPETQVRKVMAQQNTQDNPPRFIARFLTTGDREYPAVLSEYSSRADQATGTYEFVFTVTPDPNDILFPGMTAEISVLTGESASQGFVVPLQSLMGVAGNSAHVYRVDPKTRKAVRQPVTFETLAGSDDVKVMTGLTGNDLVVEKGAAFIRQGETLQFDLPKIKGTM